VCLLNRDAFIVGVGNKVVEGVSAAAAGLASRRAVLHRHVLPPDEVTCITAPERESSSMSSTTPAAMSSGVRN
jgi:hypothetical protein